MSQAFEFVYFWRACWRAWRSPYEFTYVAYGRNGVPTVAVVIGRNRQAWRVSDLASNIVGLSWKQL